MVLHSLLLLLLDFLCLLLHPLRTKYCLECAQVLGGGTVTTKLCDHLAFGRVVRSRDAAVAVVLLPPVLGICASTSASNSNTNRRLNLILNRNLNLPFRFQPNLKLNHRFLYPYEII